MAESGAFYFVFTLSAKSLPVLMFPQTSPEEKVLTDNASKRCCILHTPHFTEQWGSMVTQLKTVHVTLTFHRKIYNRHIFIEY